MSDRETATFAGGCFWCMVEPFDERPGIYEVISGYTGGQTKDPTYEQVTSGKTGHLEAVQIIFNPEIMPYEKLLETFWQQIDPTDPSGQFNDRGTSYKTAIFYHNKQQQTLAEKSKQSLVNSNKFTQEIVTPILPAQPFYPAEEEHQYYYKKQPFHYNLYKKGSGRQAFIEQNWRSKKDKSQLKQRLTPIQYAVTQEDATEQPFNNEYWDHEEEVYMLTSSQEKYYFHLTINMMPNVVGQALQSQLINTILVKKKIYHTEWYELK